MMLDKIAHLSDLQKIGLFGILIAIAIIMLILLLTFLFGGVKKKLFARLNGVSSEVGDFRERIGIVLKYSDKYFNSLAQSASPQLLQGALGDLDMAMEHVNGLIQARHYKEADLLLAFLEGDDSLWQPEWDEIGGLHKQMLVNWRGQLEEMIQNVGKNIAHASQEMSALGVQKNRRSRKPTIMGLGEAGVRLTEELERLREEEEENLRQQDEY